MQILQALVNLSFAYRRRQIMATLGGRRNGWAEFERPRAVGLPKRTLFEKSAETRLFGWAVKQEHLWVGCKTGATLQEK